MTRLQSLLSILHHPAIRVFRLILALALLLTILAAAGAQPSVESSPTPAVAPIAQAEAEQRLHTIATQMETIRFCRRASGCKYRDITVQVRPDTSVPFVGEIDAIMDRPSAVLDKAHYRFQFQEGRWHLMGGEELSDVSSFFFDGDEYEVFSSYSARTRINTLSNASSTLRVGYRDLYYQVLDQGVERDPVADAG